MVILLSLLFAFGLADNISPKDCKPTKGDIVYTNAVSATIYSPMHLQAYPAPGAASADQVNLAIEMDADLEKIAKTHIYVRSYYSAFYDVALAPIAHKHGLKLFLGVYFTKESWFAGQKQAALEAAVNYTDNVAAIIMGHDNIGEFTPEFIIKEIESFRKLLATHNVNVPVGTAQTVDSWLHTDGMMNLANACDFIGFKSSSFFDVNFNPKKPLAILDRDYNSMTIKYPGKQLYLTETSWFTNGTKLAERPNNVPSLENSIAYYKALLKWCPDNRKGAIFFWFMMFDRRHDDTSIKYDFEQYCGFYDEKGNKKEENFPYALNQLSMTNSDKCEPM